MLEFQVVDKGKSLLGCKDCKRPNLVVRNTPTVLKAWDQPQSPITSRLTKTLNLSSTHSKKIIAALRERQKELEDMETEGIIKKFKEPTAWVNSMVITEKNPENSEFASAPET